MRKRISRPPRFAAVDNKAIDTIPSILATGLLTTLIRAKDGDDVTVEGLAREKTEGREALTKAMRILVEGAYVVKFKIQRAVSEVVELEDGTTETKRGGSWYTTFTVDSIPFKAQDVADMLEEIYEDGNVKAVRVEPTHLDPRKTAGGVPAGKTDRPTTGKPSVGPTCGNVDSEHGLESENPENSGSRPTAGKPTVGRPTAGGPTVGEAAALYRSKTSLSLSDSAAAPGGSAPDGEREEDAPEQDTPPPAAEAGRESDPLADDTAQVLDAYEEALGGKALNGTRTKLLKDAAELLAARPLWWVMDRARELPRYGTDLAKHAAMSKVPFTRKSATRPAGLPKEDPDYKPVKHDMRNMQEILASMRQTNV